MYIVIRNTSLRNSTFGEYCQHVFTYKHHGALILCYAFFQQLVHLLVKAGDCRSGQAKSQLIDRTPSYEKSSQTKKPKIMSSVDRPKENVSINQSSAYAKTTMQKWVEKAKANRSGAKTYENAKMKYQDIFRSGSDGFID